MYYNDFSQKRLLKNGKAFFENIKDCYNTKYWEPKGYMFLGTIHDENSPALDETLEILGYHNYIVLNSLAFDNKGNVISHDSSLLLKLEYRDEINFLRFYHLLIVMMAERKEVDFYG